VTRSKYSLLSLLFVSLACTNPPAQTPERHATAPEQHDAGNDHEHRHEDQGHQGRHEGHDQKGHHHEGPLVHSFEDAEKWSKRFDDPQRAAWQKPAAVVTAMKIGEGMTVADVGTGTGYFLPYLSPAVGKSGKVLALDIEEGMIAFVKKRAEREGLANVDARVVPLDDPGLQEASVDRILVVNTWHHIPSRAAYVKKLAGALKPGGSLWVVDFTLETQHGPPKKHRLPPELVAAELKGGGLEARIDRETLPEQYIAVGNKPAG
jgi:SAM-dependent methyltransferase